MHTDLSERVQRSIDALLATTDAPREPQRAVARQFGVLPLIFGWSGTIAMRPSDGEIVRFDDSHPLYAAGIVETDPGWRMAALVRASIVFPELVHLRPARSTDATTCAQCNGSGMVDHEAGNRVLCGACWGLGWINQTMRDHDHRRTDRFASPRVR